MASSLAWYVLVHQLPPRPLYLRAKIRQRLARVGATALKGSVYVLPRRDECLEDFEWIAEEARAGNGEAWIGEARFVDRRVDEELVRRSRAERNAEYRELSGELRVAPAGVNGAARLARARKRLDEIAGIDFFAAPGRNSTGAVIERMEKRLERRSRTMKTEKKARTKDLVGRTWVTRRGIKVDRIAATSDDRRRLERGFALFDDLYASFRTEPRLASRPDGSSRR